MNLYAVLIVVTLVAEYLLGLVADLLNLRTLGTPLPAEFQGVYDPAAYRRSQEYTRVKTRFGVVSSTAGLCALLLFWWCGGFRFVDELARSFSWGELWTGMAYVAFLAAGRLLLSLPFSLYSTFVIEERFGFNRTTPATFLTDLVTGLLLTVAVGGPLVALLLWLFMTAGAGAWLACWGAVTFLLLAVQFVAPMWIMPLFNTFTPLEDGELRRAILEYTGRVRFPLEGLYVMDGSKRSSKSNAFFTGFGRFKRIALFDTLVRKHSVPELVAVLAHEIGHYKLRHIVKGIAVSVLHMGLLLFLLSRFLSTQGLYEAFFIEKMSVHAGLVLFGMLFTPVEFFLALGMNMLSRKHEFEADRFAAETTGAPGDLVSALRGLSVDNLSHLTPHPLYVVLHHSHPPVIERIRALTPPPATSLA
jgi:STE24 endopeptidase